MTTAINPYPDDIAPPADGRQTTENSSDLVRCDNCGRRGWHTSDRCPDELIDVPLPTGANPSEWWDVEDGEPTFRCVEGTPHLIGKSRTRIYTHCTQWEDGSVEDGKTEPASTVGPGWRSSSSTRTATRWIPVSPSPVLKREKRRRYSSRLLTRLMGGWRNDHA
jgi:hypothetical protein